MNTNPELQGSPRMNRPVAAALVHESETQRQHVRARLPGVLELELAEGPQRFRLQDLSAGGLAFAVRGRSLRSGQLCEGRVLLQLESITLTVPVRLQICWVDAQGGRAGARFETLADGEAATLRRVIGAYLGGEVIGAGDVMHTLSRSNLTAPRARAEPVARSRGARFRAFAQTTLILIAGVAALVYVVQRIDEQLLGARSTAARVSGPSYQVAMPRDGVFRSLVPADGIVRKGTPLGSFETSMLGMVGAQALEASLTPQQIDALLGKQIKGTVTSPCDCRVASLYVSDEQYVAKGERIADLAPIEFDPYVLARFNADRADRLTPGAPVSLRISGEALARSGKVAQMRPGGSDVATLSDDIVVVVEPDEALPMELMSRPVEVSARERGWSSAPALDGVFAARVEAHP
jgi:mannuronan synthase